MPATLLDFYLFFMFLLASLSRFLFKMSWHLRSKPVRSAKQPFSSGRPSFPAAASQLLVSWCPAAFLPTAGFLRRAPFSSDLASSACRLIQVDFAVLGLSKNGVPAHGLGAVGSALQSEPQVFQCILSQDLAMNLLGGAQSALDFWAFRVC